MMRSTPLIIHHSAFRTHHFCYNPPVEVFAFTPMKRKAPMLPRPNPFSRALSAWLLAAVVLLCPSVRLASAQDTVTGAFEGTVTDGRTGRPIARARVEFVNQQTGVVVTKLSDSQGRFYQGLLQPGTYTIRASAAGCEPGETVQRLAGMRTGEVVPVPIILDPSPAGGTQPTPTPSAAATPQPTTTPST